MKKMIFTLLVTATLMTSCTTIPNEETVELHEIYPRTMTVTDTNTEQDLVILIDAIGHTWSFYGIEDWEIGDICSCIMHTNGTEIITDDEIISTRYNGRGGN